MLPPPPSRSLDCSYLFFISFIMTSHEEKYDLESRDFYKYMEQIADKNWAWEDPDDVDRYICNLDDETLQSHWENFNNEYYGNTPQS